MSYFANKNKVSTLNSSTTLLNAAAVFTGTWEDVSSYSSLTIAVKTDQNGTYQIQFSPDGTNADSTLTRYYRTDQIEPPHRFTVTRKYARIVFTNTSASNQTYLRLQTMLGDQSDLNVPLDSVISQDYDSASVRPTRYEYEVSLGRRQGATTWSKFGYNDDIDIGTETIWASGGTFTPLSSASTFTIVSSSANDTAAGTGARTLLLYYIDANRVAQTETITLNGTTPVVSSGTGLGINRCVVVTSGTTTTNEGNITITATTGGTTQAYLPLGEGITQQCIFFTQANHKLLTDYLHINVNKITGGGASPRVTIKGWVHSFDTGCKILIFRDTIDTNVDNHTELKPTQPFTVNESSVLWFECTTDTNNTTCQLRFSGIEVKDIDA